jgi:predicted O-linked N-acetylglucosamine transferase (SPINDLY family)
MTIWVIAMASFRLAPIQIMSYGHPATSNSPMIDYGIIEEDTFNADRFSEKVIPLPANVVRPTEFEKVTVRHTPRKTDVIRIGVAAMQVKVSWPFVMAMQEVAKRANKKIEFWFFSACHGVGLYSFANEMAKLLPNVTVQQAQPYREYLETLAQCDLALFSFPFGGTNSMIDAMSIGLPMVTLLGDEPHSMSDTALVRRAGLPESLVCKSMADYVLAVLRMQDDEYRHLVAELVRGVDVERKFFQADESKTFLKTFEQIYEENTEP